MNHGASHRHIFDVQTGMPQKLSFQREQVEFRQVNFTLTKLKCTLTMGIIADPFSKQEVEKLAKFRMKLLPK